MDNNKICYKLRQKRGNTPRKEVAKAIGVSESSLEKYEYGERMPRDDVKGRLADYYNCSVGYLFYDEKSHI